jgi:hypothetical protein
MRSRLLPLVLLLAALVGGFALASAVAVSAPDANRRVAAYAPLVVQDSARAKLVATIAQAATETLTPTDTPTATNTPTATPENCDPEADLSGQLIDDSQGRVVNASAECSYDVGLASYRAFDRHVGNQELFDSTTATILPRQTIELTVAVAGCASQIDLFYGPLLLSLEDERYGERLLDSHFAGGPDFCPPGTPTPTGTAMPSPSPTEPPTPTDAGGG